MLAVLDSQVTLGIHQAFELRVRAVHSGTTAGQSNLTTSSLQYAHEAESNRNEYIPYIEALHDLFVDLGEVYPSTEAKSGKQTLT